MSVTGHEARSIRCGTVLAPTPLARKASMGAAFDERRLVQAAATGDQRAWDGLVDRFGELVWSTARAWGLNSEQGADVVQVTWLRLAEQLDRTQDNYERLGVWLAATARRESQRLLSADLGTEPGPAVTSGPPVISRATGSARDGLLWRVVHELPERCRRLLRILMTTPPPSHEEVAAALDLPVARVGGLRSDCLQDFRGRMAKVHINTELRDD
jgi:DNA-directed RNA polymerase specialized sigma24 family protein